jgi:hypothetical protein
MSPHQAIAVAVRLFAVWLLIYLIPGVVGFYVQYEKHDDPYKLAIAVAVTVVAAVIVLALWLFPQTIARRLLTPSSTVSGAPASPDMWLAMGCALIGLWMFASSLPALISNALILHFAQDAYQDTSQIKHTLLYDFGRTLIAGWLMFGAKGFRKLFWWARYAGIGEPSNNRWRGP